MYPRPDGTVYVCGEPQALPVPPSPSEVTVEQELIHNIRRVAGSLASCLKEVRHQEVGTLSTGPATPVQASCYCRALPALDCGSLIAVHPCVSPLPVHTLPSLPQAPVESSQSCYLPCAPDSLPVIGPVPGVEGVLLATGHTCWGVLNGPGTGLLLAEMVAEGRATSLGREEVEAFRVERFARRGAGAGAAGGR